MISDNQVHVHPEYNKMRTLATVSMTVASTLFFNILFTKNREIKELRKESKQRIDYSIHPEIRDVNQDGFEDIILQRYNGEKLVLYGTQEREYNFDKRERR